MKKKRLTVATLLGAMLLILSGCVRTDKHGHPIGWVYNYMAKPMQHLMTWLAQHMGNYLFVPIVEKGLGWKNNSSS